MEKRQVAKKALNVWSSSGKNTVSKIFGLKAIADGASIIKATGKNLLNPKEAIKNARVETFQEAVQRLNISDDDLNKNYKNFAVTTYISLFFALVCIYNAFNFLVFKGSVMASLSSLSILAVCLSLALKYSFRAYQIKHRNLCTVKEFLANKKELIPTWNKG